MQPGLRNWSAFLLKYVCFGILSLPVLSLHDLNFQCWVSSHHIEWNSRNSVRILLERIFVANLCTNLFMESKNSLFHVRPLNTYCCIFYFKLQSIVSTWRDSLEMKQFQFNVETNYTLQWDFYFCKQLLECYWNNVIRFCGVHCFLTFP